MKLIKYPIAAIVAGFISQGILFGEAQGVADHGNVHTDMGVRSVDKAEHVKNHPESMPKGYLGEGKYSSGESYGKGEPVVGSCSPDNCQP